jgi:hypothetical protein
MGVGNMKRIVTCSHPYLQPTEWNQPKPEVWEGETCACGCNWTCPVCGYGEGKYPCECMKDNCSWKFIDKEWLEPRSNFPNGY